MTPLEINNPLVLQNGNPGASDFTAFVTFIGILNDLCYYFYDDNKEITIDNIISKLGNKTPLKLTLEKSVSFDIINNVINEFVTDYKILMKTKLEDNYILFMPINYLMYKLKYDGMINTFDSFGRKYLFNGEFKIQGFATENRIKQHLPGRLIFNTLIFQNDKI